LILTIHSDLLKDSQNESLRGNILYYIRSVILGSNKQTNLSIKPQVVWLYVDPVSYMYIYTRKTENVWFEN